MMNDNSTFNPREHLITIKNRQVSSDYLPVQWRLVWFRNENPQGTIDTEEVEVDLDREMSVDTFVWNAEKRRSEKVTRTAKGYARFRAVVTDGKGGRATGTGSECAADFADFIEKSETKAIGRALAALGYGTQFAPEFQEGHRIVDAPVDFGNNISNNTNNSNGNSAPPMPAARPNVIAGNGNGNGSSNGNGSPATSAEQAAEGSVTEQQLASIRKLCERLGKDTPENVTSISFLNARKLIMQLTNEFKEQRQSSKAS